MPPKPPKRPIIRQLHAIQAQFANGASINAASSNDIRSVEAQKRLRLAGKKKFNQRI